MNIEDFIRNGVLILESEHLQKLENDLYDILAEKGGFPVEELKEKAALHLDFSGKEQRVTMARQFSMTASLKNPEEVRRIFKEMGGEEIKV